MMSLPRRFEMEMLLRIIIYYSGVRYHTYTYDLYSFKTQDFDIRQGFACFDYFEIAYEITFPFPNFNGSTVKAW